MFSNREAESLTRVVEVGRDELDSLAPPVAVVNAEKAAAGALQQGVQNDVGVLHCQCCYYCRFMCVFCCVLCCVVSCRVVLCFPEWVLYCGVVCCTCSVLCSNVLCCAGAQNDVGVLRSFSHGCRCGCASGGGRASQRGEG